MSEKVPKVDGRFVCIVDSEAVVLAAVVSSYLHQYETYPPVFLFPKVKHGRDERDHPFGDQYLSNLAGRAAAVYINNAWARLGSRETVILAGLSDEQKSYLLLPDGPRVLDVDSVSTADSVLRSLPVDDRGELRCKSSEVLRGLASALRQGKRLVIDEKAEIDYKIEGNKCGIVVVESPLEDASPVIAINYARSVDADAHIVAPLGKYEGREMSKWIHDWKETGDISEFETLKKIAVDRIGEIDFQNTNMRRFLPRGCHILW